jgi:hypothetical protein
MRDPDLVVRAQRAAEELERAWDRWRTMHGFGTDPLPPVSSYVGYSLEEPWGQPRVVFGIDAREAEQLTALLDQHDYDGPIYAAVARPGPRPEEEANGRPAEPGAGLLRVPTQAPAGGPQRESAPREKTAEPAPPETLLTPLEPPGRRDNGRDGRRDNGRDGRRDNGRDNGGPGWGPATDTPAAAGRPAEPGREAGRDGGSAARDGEDAGDGPPALVAFRPRHDPPSHQDDDEEPGSFLDDPAPFLDDPAPSAEADQATVTWTRPGRVTGGHAMPRQKRGGAAKPSGGKQEARDRAGLDAMAADLAGWAAGELPGQASHRCPPRQICWQGRHSLG